MSKIESDGERGQRAMADDKAGKGGVGSGRRLSWRAIWAASIACLFLLASVGLGACGFEKVTEGAADRSGSPLRGSGDASADQTRSPDRGLGSDGDSQASDGGYDYDWGDDDGYWGDDDGYWGDDDGYWGDDDGYDGYEGASETSRVSIINYTLYGFTRAYVTFAGMGGYGYYDDSFLEGKVLISEYQVTVDVLRDRLVYDLFMVDEDGDEWVWEGITLTDGCEAYVNLTDGGLPKLTVYHLNGDVDEHTGYYK